MRIAIVNQHLMDAVGGSELQCDLVAKGLASRGHEVRYLVVDIDAAPGPPDGSRESETEGRYPIRRVARRPDAIVAACIEAGADVVYWRFNRPMLTGVVRGLRAVGIPLVFAVAHIDDVRPWPVRPWPRAGLRDVLGEIRPRVQERSSWRAFASVAAIAAQRADFLGRVPVNEQQVVRNLVLEEIESFAWPRPYVAWVGSLQQRKRPDLLPGIADALRPSGVDVVVAGQIRDPRYAHLVDPASAPSNLHHVGLVAPPLAMGLLAGARALIMTGHEEGFANVLIQAWWHGTPTVTLEHDPDGIIAGHGLGIVAGGDAARLHQGLLRLLDEPPAAARARREAVRAFARAEFDPVRTLGALEALLRAAAVGR